MNKYIWIDPDSGWKFGFPKVIREDLETDDDWWVAQGYRGTSERKGPLYVRAWPATEEEYKKFGVE